MARWSNGDFFKLYTCTLYNMGVEEPRGVVWGRAVPRGSRRMAVGKEWVVGGGGDLVAGDSKKVALVWWVGGWNGGR
jgi:hypothetical protein